MGDLSSLLQWLPQGGAAAAVIIVVWMFLNQQDKLAALLVSVTDKFTEALKDHQEKADQRLSSIAEKNLEHNEKTQEQVNTLVRDQIVSNTQMTEAIKGLQVAVGELQKKE